MKATVKVSISGVAFNLEDDAYAILKKYLDELEAYFAKREGGKEIIDDMEARIAELLLSHISNPEQPIGAASVQEVIAVMGRPEELGAGEERKPTDTGTSAPSGGTRKRFYRDPDNQVVAGVCGGLGAYFNLDPILFRLLFVVLALSGTFFIHFSAGTIMLVYLVLWIAVPQAKTMAQKMELRGESPTAANIERKLREEMAGLSTRIKSNSTVFGRLLKVFFIVAGILIGIPIIIVGLGLIVTLVALMLTGGWIINGGFFSLFSFVSLSGVNPILVQVLVLLVLLIPIMLLIYAGLRLIFRFKTKTRRVIGVSAAVWLLSLITLAGVGGYAVKGYRSSSQLSQIQTLETKSDTLYLRLPAGFENSHNRFHIGWDDDGDRNAIPLVWKNEKEDKIFLFSKVRVRYVDDSAGFSIKYTSYARGNNRSEARRKASELQTMYEVNDSLITLNPMEFSKHRKWSGEASGLVIYVPKSKTLVMDDELLYDAGSWGKHGRFYRNGKLQQWHDNDDWDDWDDWDD